MQFLDAWQIEGVERMRAMEASGGQGYVLADRMGSGKTLQAAALLTRWPIGDDPALVVCPSGCVELWRDALRQLHPHKHPPIVLLPACSASLPTGLRAGDVVVTTHALLRSAMTSMRAAGHLMDLAKVRWARVVIDEADRACALGSASRAALVALSQVRHKWALSGCDATARTSRQIVDAIAWAGALQPHGILVRPGDPSRIRKEAVVLDFEDGGQRQLYDRLDRVRRAWPCSETALRCRQACAGIEVACLGIRKACAVRDPSVRKRTTVAIRQACVDALKGVDADARAVQAPSLKARWLADEVARAQAKGDRFVVFATWRSEALGIQRALGNRGIATIVVTGELPVQEQTSRLAVFEDHAEVRVLVLTLGIGTCGINLQCASRVVLMSPRLSSFAEAQATARLDRKGQRAPSVPCQVLVLGGTLEEDAS